MAQIAADLGVSREGLYKSLSPGNNPAFGTVVKTLDNLGFKLNIELKPPLTAKASYPPN
jgi:probable addiction module antidote protein